MIFDELMDNEAYDNKKIIDDVVDDCIKTSPFANIFKQCNIAIVQEFNCIVMMCQMPNGYVVVNDAMICNSLESDIIRCFTELEIKICKLIEYKTYSFAREDFCEEDYNDYEKADNCSCSMRDDESYCDDCPYFYECLSYEYYEDSK